MRSDVDKLFKGLKSSTKGNNYMKKGCIILENNITMNTNIFPQFYGFGF